VNGNERYKARKPMRVTPHITKDDPLFKVEKIDLTASGWCFFVFLVFLFQKLSQGQTIKRTGRFIT
jgi:hypothetical protein